MQILLFTYHDSCKLLLQILQYTPAQQIYAFSVCVLVAYLTGIDKRRNYNCEMPPREIQWPTLIGLHYDEFRATASGIFSLYKKKSFIIVFKSTETFVFKNGICSVDQRNQHLLKLNF